MAWVLLVFLAIVWGLSFILIKRVTNVYSAIEIGAGRVFIAALVLSPWAFSDIKNYPKEKNVWFLLSGFLGFFLPAFIFAYLGSRINSSLAGTLNSTTPIFTLIVGALFFATAITKNQVLGILLGFAGSLLLVLSGSDGELNFDNPLALLALAATVMYGFNIHIIGKHFKNIKPVKLTAYTLMVVGAASLVILILFTDFFPKSFNPDNLQSVIFMILLGGFNSAVAVVIFNYVLQITSPLFGSSVTYLIPVVATISGAMDGEIISFWHLMGMVVILLGIYLINKK